MKNVIKYLPVFLLLSYIILCFFRKPEFADSFIVMALSTLYGAMWWKQVHVEKLPEVAIPDHIQKLQEQITKLRMESEVIGLQKNIASIKSLPEGLSNEKARKFQF